jgi:hypothetical protein
MEPVCGGQRHGRTSGCGEQRAGGGRAGCALVLRSRLRLRLIFSATSACFFLSWLVGDSLGAVTRLRAPGGGTWGVGGRISAQPNTQTQEALMATDYGSPAQPRLQPGNYRC